MIALLPSGKQARQPRPEPRTGLTHEELNDALAMWWRRLQRRFPRGYARLIAGGCIEELVVAILEARG